MKVHIIGLGLIGSSFAISMRELFPNVLITGSDNNPEHVKQALELGHIDRCTDEMSQADWIVLAVPVNVIASIAENVLDQCGEQTLVMDMGSTKGMICRSVSGHPRRSQLLAAHPIAGTEFSGPKAGIPDLFRNKTMVLCEADRTGPQFLSRALEVLDALQMQIRHMDPEAHDRHIAYVSHLSHISSFMLGKTVLGEEKRDKDILDLAGSGFSSTVRLAKSSPAMWTPIFQQNRARVLESLDHYIQNLTHFRELLEQEDFEEVYAEMERVQPIKKILSGIQ